MSINFFSENFKSLFTKNYTLIDVRSPGEFLEGSFPGAINLPLLDNEQRHLVGLKYKNEGQDEAIKLGHQLINAEVKKERVFAWSEQIKKNPTKTVLYCFRGGLRSQISQQFLKEAGIDIPIIQGGQKALRNFLLSTLEKRSQDASLLVLTGLTGSQKTDLIEQFMITQNFPCIDLEGLANHKGSAFGTMGKQPSQIDFENSLAVELIKLEKENRPILVEDESIRVGNRVIPKSFFNQMLNSPLIELQLPLAERATWIRKSYVEKKWQELKDSPNRPTDFFDFFALPLSRIKNRLSTENYLDCIDNLTKGIEHNSLSHHEMWIAALLEFYYDPLYQKHINKYHSRIIKRVNLTELLPYLTQYYPKKQILS